MHKRFFVSLAMGVASASVVLADQHTFRQEDSHVHGVAKLNVVVENQQLLMELESPAANIVGFEHKPGNAEQEEAVHKAEETLQDGAKLFALPDAAACQLTAAEVKWTLEEEHEDHDQHEKDEHAEHEHDKDEHAEHEKDEHDHDKDEHAHEEHAHEEGETHSEFHVEYAFQCGSPDKLDSIEVLLFQAFPGMEEIEAQVIGPNGQTAVELTAEANRIDL